MSALETVCARLLENKRQMRIGTSELTSVDCDLKEQSLVNSSKDIAEKKEGRNEYFGRFVICLD